MSDVTLGSKAFEDSVLDPAETLEKIPHTAGGPVWEREKHVPVAREKDNE